MVRRTYIAETLAQIASIELEEFLAALTVAKAKTGSFQASKECIRKLHAPQREERLNEAYNFISRSLPKCGRHFADGAEVDVERIDPHFEIVKAGTDSADLFRLATYTWSVPVSEGYGRRMRFLVWDRNIGKLIGVIALGDPVFNLKARDQLIGWSTTDRKERLVNIMDAYVLGAVPPYSHLLGGKLVACLVRTKEIKDHFAALYGQSKGIISEKSKGAALLAVTTTSSMGRSSIYNRLRPEGKNYFERIGFTSGFGHFHVPAQLFELLRSYLFAINHPYADGNRYGNGPNWKFRAIRAAFEQLGFDRKILMHGIRREVFITHFASNSIEALQFGFEPDFDDLKSASHVAEAAKQRWLIPRSLRLPIYREHKATNWLNQLMQDVRATRFPS